METTMTLSHLADLIIVISFCSMCGASFGYMVAELVSIAFDGIKKKLAERKAKAAVEQLVTPDYDGTMIVLGSDTMVVFRGRIFGKPRDAADAARMLRALSGHGHDVHTAVSLWAVHAPAGQDVGLFYRTFVDTTYVYFRDLSEDEIAAYIASGDPFDKAGAYGIQSGGGAFVDHIEGSLDTVIGFPVERLKAEFPDIFDPGCARGA